MLPALALIAAIFITVVPAKQAVLTTVFILSFQVDIYLRFLYGRASSNEGLALPLVVVAGAILLGWYYFSGHIREFKWGGSMRRPIAALLFIMAASVAASSERFLGLSDARHSAVGGASVSPWEAVTVVSAAGVGSEAATATGAASGAGA